MSTIFKVICVALLLSVALARRQASREMNEDRINFKNNLRNLPYQPRNLPKVRKPSKRTVPVIPRDTSGVYQNLKVASFNVRVFGLTKMGYPNVPGILVNIILRYDVILIMEIRDTTNQAIHDLLNRVNRASNAVYNIVISPRLGRTNSKEEYAFLYRADALSVVKSYTYDDGKEELLQDTFEREPFIVQFRTTNAVIKDFVMVAIHTSPSSAPQEVDSLVDVYDDVIAKWAINDVIILGDFNSACSYMSDDDWKVNRLYNDQRFTWVTHDCMDTTVGSTVCAYDRFVISGSKMKKALVPGSADRFLFDSAYNLTNAMAILVSDHYPIELELYSKDFASALQSIQETTEYKYYSRTPPYLTASDIYGLRYRSNVLLANGFIAKTHKSSSGSIAVITNKKKVTSSQDASQAFALINTHWGHLLTKEQVDLATQRVAVDFRERSFANANVIFVCRKIPAPVECWVALEL